MSWFLCSGKLSRKATKKNKLKNNKTKDQISSISDNNILGRAFCSGGFVWLAGDHEFQLYECERVKEARMHGIQTLVCIATLSGVLELASLDVIKQDWGLVHLTKSLFRSNDDDDDHNRLSNQQASREASGLVPTLQHGRFLEAQ
ncbi:hypothetical protein ACFX12_009650 [Malus domestica]